MKFFTVVFTYFLIFPNMVLAHDFYADILVDRLTVVNNEPNGAAFESGGIYEGYDFTETPNSLDYYLS